MVAYKRNLSNAREGSRWERIEQVRIRGGGENWFGLFLDRAPGFRP